MNAPSHREEAEVMFLAITRSAHTNTTQHRDMLTELPLAAVNEDIINSDLAIAHFATTR